MADIAILVGTEFGASQMVAEAIQARLTPEHQVVIHDTPDFAQVDLARREIIIICTSTFGVGDLPDNLLPFFKQLESACIDLKHIRYAVVGLGDQTYKDFCQAGRDMDQLFASKGAQRIGERLEIDACTQPLADEEALNWLNEIESEL